MRISILRNTNWNLLILKMLLFGILAGGILAAEHYVLLVFHPDAAAALAVRQMEPSDDAVQSLRLYEAVKNYAMTVTGCAVVLIGFALFQGNLRTVWADLTRTAARGTHETT